MIQLHLLGMIFVFEINRQEPQIPLTRGPKSRQVQRPLFGLGIADDVIPDKFPRVIHCYDVSS